MKPVSPAEWIIVKFIRLYQLVISPLIPPACRYTPTCSEYGITAVREYGALRGGWMTIRRLSRCHPWGGHGYDPVPKKEHVHEKK